MPLVVDASVALAWALPDENDEFAESVFRAAEQSGLMVPDLWAWEVANGLTMAYLRKRMTSEDQHEFLAVLSQLHIEVESAAPVISAIKAGAEAASRLGLTAYDAAYVDLSLRNNLTLSTLDKAMSKAAKQVGVVLFK